MGVDEADEGIEVLVSGDDGGRPHGKGRRERIGGRELMEGGFRGEVRERNGNHGVL